MLDPESAALIQQHNLAFSGNHTDLQPEGCQCHPKNAVEPGQMTGQVVSEPKRFEGLPDGGVCFKCGGMTVRTGTCTTCTSCGETGGCG